MTIEGDTQEEWWTTEMVCRYLNISRGALWLQRRAEASHFPHSIRFGGKRNLYPASKVRDWAERKSWAVQSGPNPLHIPRIEPPKLHPKPLPSAERATTPTPVAAKPKRRSGGLPPKGQQLALFEQD